MSTNITLGSVEVYGGVHASIIQFDFSSQSIKISPKSDGNSIPSTVYQTLAMTNLDGLRYTIEVGRKNRNLYAALTNYKTNVRIEVLANEQTNFIYPAGWLYDIPTFAWVSGDTPYFKRVWCTVPRDKYIAFMGDSITEGYGVAQSNCWAKKCADYFGNSIIVARSGATIDCVLRQLDDIIPVVSPKIIVVTIGTNGGNTVAKLTQLIEKVKNLGAVLILDNIYLALRSDRGLSWTTPINEMIMSMKQFGARFDIATALNNVITDGANPDYLQSDLLHLNVAGNAACYERFINDISFLKL